MTVTIPDLAPSPASSISNSIRTLLEYYWSFGRDIADKQYANTYGSAFFATLSHDLRTEMLGEQGFSETNINYMYRFYELYSSYLEIFYRV